MLYKHKHSEFCGLSESTSAASLLTGLLLQATSVPCVMYVMISMKAKASLYRSHQPSNTAVGGAFVFTDRTLGS